MRTTERWLEEKVSAYNENPKEALEDMLSTTTDVIEQYIKSPSIATKGVLEACLEHNKLFLQKVGSESFENYFKRQVKDGFISENGTPLKCECGCTNFKQVDKYFGEGYLEEYALECTNEDCLKIVGRWSYGSWMV